jgi:hypothetical protein
MMHNGAGFIERPYSQVLVLGEMSASEYFDCRGKDISPLHRVQTSSGTKPPIQQIQWALFTGYSGWSMLTTCFYLALITGMNGAQLRCVNDVHSMHRNKFTFTIWVIK